MPVKRKETVAKKTGKKDDGKSISQMIEEINVFDEENFKFTNEELDSMILELQTASSARSPEEIDEVNSSKFESAMKSMQFASISSDKAVLSSDDVKESDKIVDGVSQDVVKLAMKSILVFAFVHGNVTSKKSWIKMTHVENGKSKYVSLPLLNSVGSRSVLVHVFRAEISKFLSEGKKNTLCAILEKSNVKVAPEKVKYLFPKGHLLVKKEEIELVRNDLNQIFSQMQNPIEKRDFKLKWFTI